MARLLVCSSCFEDLQSHGATPVHEPREGSLMDRCVVHPLTHAMNVLEVPAALAVECERLGLAPVELDPATVGDAAIVATLAASLLSGAREAGSSLAALEIEDAVRSARLVLAAARGEAIR